MNPIEKSNNIASPPKIPGSLSGASNGPSTLQLFGVSVVSGAVGAVAGLPADIVRARRQIDPNAGMFQIIRDFASEVKKTRLLRSVSGCAFEAGPIKQFPFLVRAFVVPIGIEEVFGERVTKLSVPTQTIVWSAAGFAESFLVNTSELCKLGQQSGCLSQDPREAYREMVGITGQRLPITALYPMALRHMLFVSVFMQMKGAFKPVVDSVLTRAGVSAEKRRVPTGMGSTYLGALLGIFSGNIVMDAIRSRMMMDVLDGNLSVKQSNTFQEFSGRLSRAVAAEGFSLFASALPKAFQLPVLLMVGFGVKEQISNVFWPNRA